MKFWTNLKNIFPEAWRLHLEREHGRAVKVAAQVGVDTHKVRLEEIGNIHARAQATQIEAQVMIFCIFHSQAKGILKTKVGAEEKKMKQSSKAVQSHVSEVIKGMMAKASTQTTIS